MNRAELFAGAAGDPGILSLGVDADDGAIGGQQIGDDGSDALAGSRRRHGQQMGRPVISHEAFRFRVAADQQAGIGSGEGSDFLVGGEACGTMGVIGHVPEMEDQRIGDEPECDPQKHQQRDNVQSDIRNAAGTEA
ncbi:Uncharacterised protein [Mycobacterium tuberculosis]|nr:Uncharacterised protein [Mycobacterium tuberculosis]